MRLASNFHNFRPKKISVDSPAFTLVELLAVIAIIAILAALLLAAVSQRKPRRKKFNASTICINSELFCRNLSRIIMLILYL